MKPRTQVTTALLVATVAAVGCSKQSATSQAKSGATGVPAALEQSVDFTNAKVNGEDSVAVDAAPTLTGPVSFADGEAAYQARKYSDATAIFERYIGQRPKNPWGHYMLGLSAWKSGDLAKAETAFEQALALDPRHMKSLVNLSRVFIDGKKHDDAIDRLTRAADVDPESVEVHRLLGRTYRAQGRTDEAIAAYQRAIEVNELDVWSMNNLGLLLLETERPDEALPLFARAVERRSDVAAFHNNLGMALEHTGRFRAAATAYTSALAADPGYAKAKQNLARVEAVKSGPEEPFVIAPAAKVVEDAGFEADATTASK
jgi:tetratricopeptide (TPR) repeat protein